MRLKRITGLSPEEQRAAARDEITGLVVGLLQLGYAEDSVAAAALEVALAGLRASIGTAATAEALIETARQVQEHPSDHLADVTAESSA